MANIVAEMDLWRFVGGLGIFLLSMAIVEAALNELAGRQFKQHFRRYTNTPLRGILSGTLATAILQSSSVVTLMVLSFVGAGIISMKSAIGVVIGSNLGTTFTGWIVASIGFKLDIESFAWPLIGIGSLLYTLIPKEKKSAQVFRFLSGLGLLFLGLNIMKLAMENASQIVDVSLVQSYGLVIHFFFGFVFTAIIQSSSATMMTTLAALNAGILTLPGAAAIVIGADLGTTITAAFGSIGGSPAKKQTAMAHFSFNLITDSIALLLIYPLLYFVTFVLGDQEPLLALVLFHSSFNVLGMIAFLPFTGTFARLLEKYIQPSNHNITSFIQKVPPSIPEAAIAAVDQELRFMIKEIISCNMEAFSLIKSKTSFSNTYENRKEKISTVLSYALLVQEHSMSTEDSRRLNQLHKALDAFSHSIKSAKDVHHNMVTLNDSARTENIEFQKLLSESMVVRFKRLENIPHYDNLSHIFEDLVEFEKYNNQEYQKLQKKTYGYFHGTHLNEMEIGSLLNVNRETHSSCESLRLAEKEILLPVEKAEDA